MTCPTGYAHGQKVRCQVTRRVTTGKIGCGVTSRSFPQTQATQSNGECSLKFANDSVSETVLSMWFIYIVTSHHLASYLVSMSSQWDMSYSNEGQVIVFPGETTAQDFLQLQLPDINHKIDSTGQHQLQILLDSASCSSLKDSASIRDRARLNTIF